MPRVAGATVRVDSWEISWKVLATPKKVPKYLSYLFEFICPFLFQILSTLLWVSKPIWTKSLWLWRVVLLSISHTLLTSWFHMTHYCWTGWVGYWAEGSSPLSRQRYTKGGDFLATTQERKALVHCLIEPVSLSDHGLCVVALLSMAKLRWRIWLRNGNGSRRTGEALPSSIGRNFRGKYHMPESLSTSCNLVWFTM